jgi:hypothetical protein
MVKEEFYGIHRSGKRLIKRYSDKGEYIRKVGTDEVYSEAIDLEDKPYTYEETGEVIKYYEE